MPARTIAIGDVHGCSQALAALIQAIQPAAGDVIVTLGDYVNRGPDTRGVIDQMLALENHCQLMSLLGNHDQMLLDARACRPQAFAIWLRMGGHATLLSYGASLGATFAGELARVPPEHLAFLKRCRPFFENETHIFVHAKYNPELSMDRQPDWLLRWETLRDGIPEPHVSGKSVITGHSAQKGGEILELGHLTCIDTYCYGGGWLTALDIESRQVWQASQEGKLRR
jgi:serine/threonine protein phosphatase 1